MQGKCQSLISAVLFICYSTAFCYTPVDSQCRFQTSPNCCSDLFIAVYYYSCDPLAKIFLAKTDEMSAYFDQKFFKYEYKKAVVIREGSILKCCINEIFNLKFSKWITKNR